MPKSSPLEKINEWKEKIQEQQVSGLSIKRWCRNNQIPDHVFYYWKKRLFPENSLKRGHFTELSDEKTMGITIEYGRIRIHLAKNFDLAVLMKCLRALKAETC